MGGERRREDWREREVGGREGEGGRMSGWVGREGGRIEGERGRMGGWGEKEGGRGSSKFKRVLMDGTLDKGMWPNFVFFSPYSR